MLATATPPLDTEGEQQKQLQHQQQGPRSADGEQSATKHNDDHHTESTDHSDASALPLLHGGSSTPSSRTGGTLSPDSSVDDSFALRASSPTDLATSFDAHFHYGYAQDASSSTSLLEHQHYRQQPQHPQVAGKSLPTSVALPQATLHQYQTLLADDTIMSESDDHEMSAMAAAAMNATSVVTAHDESAQAASNSEASDTTKPSVPSAAADLRLRVKLYELTGDSKWEDRGTGICCVVYVEV